MGRKSKARREQKKAENQWKPLAFLDSKTNWLIVLIVVLPLLQTKETIDGNIAIRYLAQGIFIAAYVVYFYVLKRQTIRWQFPKLVNFVFVSSLLYLLWSGLAMLWAVNVEEAIYDTSRFGLNLILIFLAMLAFFEEGFNWARFLKFVVIVSIVHCFIGFDQYFQWNITSYEAVALPSGAMLNRNLYGSFLCILMPFILYGLLSKKVDRRWPNYIVIILLIGALFISQTRSAWVASVLSSSLVFILVGIYLPENRRYLVRVIGITLGILLVIFVGSGLINRAQKGSIKKEKTERSRLLKDIDKDTRREIRELKGEEKRKRIRELTKKGEPNKVTPRGKSESIQERLTVWEETSRMFFDHPIRGVGPGNWKLHVPNYQKNETRMQKGQIVRVRPHNIYLLVLSETGIVGFVLFYLPWVLILTISFKMILHDKNQNRKLLVILLLASQVGLASDGFFSFPTERIEHSIIYLLTMGGMLGLYSQFRNAEPVDRKSRKISWLVTPLIVVIGWNLFLGAEKYEFEYRMKRARQFYLRQKYQHAVEEARMGKSKFVSLEINLDPIELVEALSLQPLKKYEEGLKAIEIAERYSPFSTRIISTRGNFHTELKQHDLAISSYKRALKLSPNHLVSIKNLALNYYFIKDYALCIEVLDRISLDDDKTFQGLYESATKKLEVEREGQINN